MLAQHCQKSPVEPVLSNLPIVADIQPPNPSMSCPLYCGGNRFSQYLRMLPLRTTIRCRPTCTYMMHLVPALDGCHCQGKSPKADAAAYTQEVYDLPEP